MDYRSVTSPATSRSIHERSPWRLWRSIRQSPLEGMSLYDILWHFVSFCIIFASFLHPPKPAGRKVVWHKMTQNDTKWCQNDTEMIQTWYKNDTGTTPRRLTLRLSSAMATICRSTSAASTTSSSPGPVFPSFFCLFPRAFWWEMKENRQHRLALRFMRKAERCLPPARVDDEVGFLPLFLRFSTGKCRDCLFFRCILRRNEGKNRSAIAWWTSPPWSWGPVFPLFSVIFNRKMPFFCAFG